MYEAILAKETPGEVCWRALGNIFLTLTKGSKRDFPGGPVIKNLPHNVGDAGSIPGQGTKILHATVQLSPCATATELAHLY